MHTCKKLTFFSRLAGERGLRGRLVYGSDMPLANTLAASPFVFTHRLSPRKLLKLSGIANPWDRDIALKEALGFRLEEFACVSALLPAGGQEKSFSKNRGSDAKSFAVAGRPENSLSPVAGTELL